MSDADYVEHLIARLDATVSTLADFEHADTARKRDAKKVLVELKQYRAASRAYREAISPRLIELARKCGDPEPGNWGMDFRNEIADNPGNTNDLYHRLTARSPRLHAMMTMLRREESERPNKVPASTPTKPANPGQPSREDATKNELMLRTCLFQHHGFEDDHSHKPSCTNLEPITRRALADGIVGRTQAYEFFNRHFGGIESYRRLCRNRNKLIDKLKDLSDTMPGDVLMSNPELVASR